MSDSTTCDACGATSTERRRHCDFLRLRLPELPERRAARRKNPVAFMDFAGDHWDACSVACMRTLLDRVEERQRAASGTWSAP